MVGVAATVLAAIVAAVIAFDRGLESAASAPERCLSAWNEDPATAAYGRHNFESHVYRSALVTLLGPDAELAESGACAVIFGSPTLDPEAFAAGQVVRDRRWLPISSLEGVGPPQLAELQAAAERAPNATLGPDGRLGALDG